MPIRSFKHKGLERLFDNDQTRGLQAGQIDKLRDMLAALDAAANPQEVAVFPGWKLHKLEGHLEGFYSLWVTGNWRLIFRFVDGDVFEVDLIDYH